MVTGDLSSNKYRSMFEGVGYFNHNDLNLFLNNINLQQFATNAKGVKLALSSDIRFTEIDLQLLNFLAQIDDIIFNAKFTNKNLAKIPYVNWAIEASNIDLEKNKYPFFSIVNNYFNDFLPKKAPSSYEDIVSIITDENYTGHLDLIFNNSKFNQGLKVKDLAASFDFQPLRVDLSSLNYTTESSKASGFGIFSVNNIKPTLEFTIDYEYADFFTRNISDTFDYLLKLGDIYDLKKMAFILNSKIEKITTKDSKLNNVIFNINNDNNIINIVKLSSNYGNANFEINGNAILNPITLNLGYALNSFPAEFITNFSNNLIPLSGGVFSLGGTLYGIGESLNQFIYNLLLSGNFIGKSIAYNNIALDDLVALINKPDYVSNNLNQDIETYFSSGSTVFNEVEGGYDFIKGVISFDELKMNTSSTSNALSLNYNLYNYDINAAFISSFYVFNFMYINKFNNPNSSELTSLKLDIGGNLLNMKKSFDFKSLSSILNKRAK
jgi:hypothetical protein